MGLAIKEHTDENVMDKTQLEFAMFPSTRAIIREVFVQKNILPEILGYNFETGSEDVPYPSNAFLLTAFGWAYVNNWHNTWEQLYVYWICPFIGAMFAGWIFRAVFLPPAPKPKTKKA